VEPGGIEPPTSSMPFMVPTYSYVSLRQITYPYFLYLL
jgi:hypothetical protein